MASVKNKVLQKNQFNKEDNLNVNNESEGESGVEESSEEESDDEDLESSDFSDELSIHEENIDDIKLNANLILNDDDIEDRSSIDSNHESETDKNDQQIDDNDDDIINDNKNYNEKNTIENLIKPKKKSKNVAKVDEYEIDSSDEEDLRNTIGNIPYEWYKDYLHIGYDSSGKKILKPPKQDEMDEFLRKMDDPLYWRTVKDRLTGQNVILTDNDVNIVQNIKRGKFPDPNYKPYEDFIDFYTYEKMIHPVTNRPETKASFIPSLSEKRKISKLVAAIKRGRLKPKPPVKKDKPFEFNYDLWEKERNERSKRLDRYIPAPKLKLPGHEESYNPPPEFLFNEEEKRKWEEQEPEERRINFVPQKYSSLRTVPAYPKFVNERFERCLDLYLCPRARKLRANVNPEDLIPKLPRPRDLQPFPSIQSIVYKGHEDIVRCISVEPMGQFLISGSDDCTVRIWEIVTGRCLKVVKFNSPVKCISWCPDKSKSICAVVVAKDVYLINPNICDKLVSNETDMTFMTSLEDNEKSTHKDLDSDATTDHSVVDWHIIQQNDGSNDDWNNGIRVIINHRFDINQITWHPNGDYFATVMPTGANKAVVIHQLSKRRSQVPFSKSNGIIQCVLFHPSRPFFFVATKRAIRVYDLAQQKLQKKLIANCNEISSMSVHPEGDNIIVGSYDLRLMWFDLDLSTKPYKTLRYHKNAIRSVAFHDRYPLFASASDDATVIISHGMVYSDLSQNALIVPVKILRGHTITNSLGITQCCFHPIEPWIFSSAADSTIILYT